MRPDWIGVYPAVTTKFHADESLDLETFNKNLDAQLKAGVHGIIICGSLGENSTLTFDEKQTLLKNTVKHIAGKVPVVICVAESITREAIRFVQESEKNGADGFMLLPPMRYPADNREIVHYLKKVAQHTNLPILLYNNPLAYKNFISLEMFKELAEEPKFEAMKESTGDIRYMTDILNTFGNRFKIMSGVDDLALESLLMGADGWVAGLVDAFPAETVAIYKLAKAGRIEEALKIYRWFFPLLHLDVSTKFIQYIKLAEVYTGLGTEYVREPRLPITGEEREKVEKIIKDALSIRPVLPVID
jgi:4-hydroxy-tetrahydrodipicolinate synthase